MTNPLIEPILLEIRTSVELDLRKTIQLSFPESSKPLQLMLEYHMGWTDDAAQGKRIRPLLLLLVHQLFTGNWKPVVEAASAIEMIHNFSLIHDDIQDKSEYRHNRVTLWKKVGLAQAINAGDALFTLGLKKIWDLTERFELDLVRKSYLILNQTCLRLTQGQYMDLDFESRNEVSTSDYLEMIGGKTTALIAACTQVAAVLANAKPDLELAALNYGMNLGLAFQLVDDYLGIWGRPEETGKSTASDLVDGKKSYPVLCGLAEENDFSSRWHQGKIQPVEAEQIARLLEKTGAREKTKAKADEYTQQALCALAQFSVDSPEAQLVENLTLWLLHREK